MMLVAANVLIFVFITASVYFKREHSVIIIIIMKFCM